MICSIYVCKNCEHKEWKNGDQYFDEYAYQLTYDIISSNKSHILFKDNRVNICTQCNGRGLRRYLCSHQFDKAHPYCRTYKK